MMDSPANQSRAVLTKNYPFSGAASKENFVEKDALELLAKHIVDQEIGLAFFHDPRRMQRDVLSDAATAWLSKHELDIPQWSPK